MRYLTQKNVDAMSEHGIPEYMHAGLIRWVEQGQVPGHFLSAVISNDLSGAVSRADLQNQAALVGYVKWFYNNAPMGCHGSPDVLRDWPAKVSEDIRRDAEALNETLDDIGRTQL